MKQFSELNIPTQRNGFEGVSVLMESILDKKITVFAYKIEESKYKDNGNGKRLCLDFEIAGAEGKRHIVFTGSGKLMDTMNDIQKGDFPFQGTIVEVKIAAKKFTYKFT